MPHGDSLLGNFSSTQSALIVPQPGSSQYFYVFTTDDFYQDDLKYGFRYSIIDICLDNGLGDIIPNQKSIKLLDTVCEKLTATKHANGTDYWIIIHKYWSDAFYSYQLSSTGIVDTIISHTGLEQPLPSSPNSTGYSIGQLKVSPNGQKLCMVSGNGYGTAQYFDFDKNTGIVSNPVNIVTDSIYQYYGASFSPDNSKLYISSCMNANGIYQFDLNRSGGNPDSVKASKVKITGTYNTFGMQLAPDGKIYIARAPIGLRTYLAAINFPNNVGLACTYQDSAIYLNGKLASMGLPNFIDSYDYSNTTSQCLTTGIVENNYNQISIFPNPFSSQTIIQPSKFFKDATFELYNAYGHQVKQIKNISGSIIILNRDNLASGLYFMKLKQDNITFTTDKLVITD